MAKSSAPAPTLSPAQRFDALVDAISYGYVDVRKRQVQFGWETGRCIVEEEQDGAMRAKYGSELIPRLAQRLTDKHGPGFSENNLRKMRQFYRLNPIQPATVELNWTDYVELLPIKNAEIRKQLEQKALKENLNARQLRQLVRTVRQEADSKATSQPPLDFPTDLQFHTFSISPHRGRLKANEVLVDCGFYHYETVTKEALKNIPISETMAYTYAATVERVVDGDTLLVFIDVGLGNIKEDRLRLRGINCPEAKTSEGQRAKAFVQRRLPKGATIVIKSHRWRKDIHGRFVADVLYRKGVTNEHRILEEPVYLNQELLDAGHAVRA